MESNQLKEREITAARPNAPGGVDLFDSLILGVNHFLPQGTAMFWEFTREERTLRKVGESVHNYFLRYWPLSFDCCAFGGLM